MLQLKEVWYNWKTSIYDPLGITINEYKDCIAINLNFFVTVDDKNFAIVASASSDFVTTTTNWLSNCTQIVSTNYNNTTLTLSSFGLRY